MACPFYGQSILPMTGGTAMIASGGNRCALVISAHSPCWMEVGEASVPAWADCPRNPEFVALNILENLHTDLVTGRQADVRLLASARDLHRLMRMRVAGDPERGA